MSKRIVVIAEPRAGKLKSVAWETIGFAQFLAEKLGRGLCIVVLGNDIEELARGIADRTGETVLKVTSPILMDYTPEAYGVALAQIASREEPYLVLMGHTYRVMDFAPRLAASLDRGFIPNCVDFQIEDGRPVFLRQVYYGKLNLHVGFKGDPPYFVSLQEGAFSAYEIISKNLPRVMDFPVTLPENLLRRKILQIVQAVQGKVDLSRAEIIVAGGRALGNKEKFQIVIELAKALGAGIGASRPVTDGGWLPKEHQIGSSGQSVSPKLYIACGISGAIQHLVGMANSGCIVAINKDPHAPIFNVADYGIVGDVFQVVPALTKLVKELRKEG
jgi:electron transfer flavoprotein alpha subunit